jgi:hypothetical protein
VKRGNDRHSFQVTLFTLPLSEAASEGRARGACLPEMYKFSAFIHCRIMRPLRPFDTRIAWWSSWTRMVICLPLYFFLKKPCKVLCPPAPFLRAPPAGLLIFGFRSLSTDVVDAVRDGAGGGGLAFAAADFALPLDLVSGSDSPEYDSSVS